MKTNISIKNTKINFLVTRTDTILNSGLNQGLNLPYSCKSGLCGKCKVKVTKGKYKLEKTEYETLSKEDISNSFTLLCQSKPISKNIEIELSKKYLNETQPKVDMKPDNYICEIISHHYITPLVKEIKIAISGKKKFFYKAGMNVEFIIPKIVKNRSYSIADPPSKNHTAELNILRFLIVCHSDNGASSLIHKDFNVGDLLRISGPYESLDFDYKKHTPILTIAGGTGIAPVYSIVKELLSKKLKEQIMLILSVRDKNEVLEMSNLYKLSKQYKNFSFKITLTREANITNTRFLSGRIEKILSNIFKDLSNHNILIAGSPGFVEHAKNKVLALKANKKFIFTDTFLPAE